MLCIWLRFSIMGHFMWIVDILPLAKLASLLWNISQYVKQTCLLERGATTFQAIIMYATWLMKLDLYIVWCDRSKRGCKVSNGSNLNYTQEKEVLGFVSFIIQWWWWWCWCWWRNWDRSHDDSHVCMSEHVARKWECDGHMVASGGLLLLQSAIIIDQKQRIG